MKQLYKFIIANNQRQMEETTYFVDEEESLGKCVQAAVDRSELTGRVRVTGIVPVSEDMMASAFGHVLVDGELKFADEVYPDLLDPRDVTDQR